MTFDKFLNKTPLAKADLCGEWNQKGTEDFDDPKAGTLAAEKLTWMRIRVKRAIKAKEIAIPKNADCTFKRGKASFAKIAETMEIRNGNALICTILAGGGEFKIVKDGKDLAEIKDARPSKKRAKAEQTEDKPIPSELRHCWINRALQDKINAEVCEASVKYWNERA